MGCAFQSHLCKYCTVCTTALAVRLIPALLHEHSSHVRQHSYRSLTFRDSIVYQKYQIVKFSKEEHCIGTASISTEFVISHTVYSIIFHCHFTKFTFVSQTKSSQQRKHKKATSVRESLGFSKLVVFDTSWQHGPIQYMLKSIQYMHSERQHTALYFKNSCINISIISNNIWKIENSWTLAMPKTELSRIWIVDMVFVNCKKQILWLYTEGGRESWQ